ncbi:MAG: hypothetical protein GY798_28185 [Hyphomicrobiales bacterium]|nr:hypothetical protein [Hyphomicrobiales bacterium]
MAKTTELEGVWYATDASIGGEPVAKIVGQRLSFTGDRFQITKDGELLFGGGFSVDEGPTPPTIRFDQNETETLRGVWLGIYRRDGAALTLSDNAPDMTKPQPRTFDDCTGDGYVLIHYTR